MFEPKKVFWEIEVEGAEDEARQVQVEADAIVEEYKENAKIIKRSVAQVKIGGIFLNYKSSYFLLLPTAGENQSFENEAPAVANRAEHEEGWSQSRCVARLALSFDRKDSKVTLFLRWFLPMQTWSTGGASFTSSSWLALESSRSLFLGGSSAPSMVPTGSTPGLEY